MSASKNIVIVNRIKMRGRSFAFHYWKDGGDTDTRDGGTWVPSKEEATKYTYMEASKKVRGFHGGLHKPFLDKVDEPPP